MDDEISDVLVLLADRLGIVSEEVFGIFVGAQPMVGIVSIVGYALTIFFAVYVGYRTNKCLLSSMKDTDGEWNEYDYKFWEPILVAIVFVVALVTLGGLFSMLGNDVLRIFAPEYMATREILGMLIP